MRLAVDGKRLVQARTGPARWLEHMLHRWRDDATPFETITCFTPRATEHAWARPPRVRHEVIPTRLPIFYWENVALRRRALAVGDVLFGASYTIPFGYPGRSVVSIQGIYEGPHAEPVPWWHRYRYSAMYRASAHGADLVLANSRSTRDDIVEYYEVPEEKIRIVYQGVGPPFGWREDRDRLRREVEAIVGFSEPYLLMVGKLSPRRHVPELLQAFAEARDRMPDPTRLLLVGPNHVGMPLDQEVARNGLEDIVVHIPHLDQEALAAVYSGAIAFLLATTHEGLSATILEAMACGAPVLTVDHATLHEGFTAGAYVVEAPEVDLLREAMVEVAGSDELRGRLSRNGLECASAFSWDRTARSTLEACAEVARR